MRLVVIGISTHQSRGAVLDASSLFSQDQGGRTLQKLSKPTFLVILGFSYVYGVLLLQQKLGIIRLAVIVFVHSLSRNSVLNSVNYWWCLAVANG